LSSIDMTMVIVRFSLFVAVTLYAWCTLVALEWLRNRHRSVTPTLAPAAEAR
jgi:hypothetical protein